MGAKSTFTQAKADAICARLADGDSLREACATVGLVAESTVRAWALDDVGPGFAAQYARARGLGYDRLADELLRIADTPVPGVKTTTKPNGDVETIEGDMIEHRKVQIDARKWMLSKMLPKVYGDKVDVAHSGNVAVSLSNGDGQIL